MLVDPVFHSLFMLHSRRPQQATRCTFVKVQRICGHASLAAFWVQDCVFDGMVVAYAYRIPQSSFLELCPTEGTILLICRVMALTRCCLCCTGRWRSSCCTASTDNMLRANWQEGTNYNALALSIHFRYVLVFVVPQPDTSNDNYTGKEDKLLVLLYNYHGAGVFGISSWNKVQTSSLCIVAV